MLNKRVLNEYKFDLGSTAKTTVSILIESFVHIFFMFIVLIVLFFAFGKLFNYISNEYIRSAFRVLHFLIDLLVIIFWNIALFRKKKIVLYNDLIYVGKNNLSDIFYLYTGIFNQKILYKNIVYCDYAEYIPIGSRRGYDFAFLIFNYDSLVKIKDKTGHKYYIPVKNADDFIDEVNLYAERARFFSKLNIDLLLESKGLSYNDLNVRWKSKDEIDSIYYTDNMGNKVELIKY